MTDLPAEFADRSVGAESWPGRLLVFAVVFHVPELAEAGLVA